MASKEWFEEWFDTKYYHQLYQHRNEEEAEKFITKLTGFLQVKKHAQILDLACGKGRHSFTLNQLGYHVMGVDLSENSIKEALKNKTADLNFAVHDMRTPLMNRTFDAVFNLFTSFGYFEDVEDNKRVVVSVNEMLVPSGIFVIDFMNAQKVMNQLINKENKLIDGIDFHINRTYNGTHIIKNISFEDDGKYYEYQEKVQCLLKDDFTDLLTNNGFEIKHYFGNYELEPFDASISDRLITIAVKK
jgi:2-polyprenyl-3-methyl-5-hydroxy-6-metoxy-1,4-benzoquinol methylase